MCFVMDEDSTFRNWSSIESVCSNRQLQNNLVTWELCTVNVLLLNTCFITCRLSFVFKVSVNLLRRVNREIKQFSITFS